MEWVWEVIMRQREGERAFDSRDDDHHQDDFGSWFIRRRDPSALRIGWIIILRTTRSSSQRTYPIHGVPVHVLPRFDLGITRGGQLEEAARALEWQLRLNVGQQAPREILDQRTSIARGVQADLLYK